MTTLLRTWTCSLNNVPSQATLDAQGKACLYAFKEAFKSAGWTCEGSSSSVAAGMDGTDRWASAANLVWAAGGVAHSWIVLKSPAGYLPNSKYVYLMLSCGTGASNQYQANISFGSGAFTGGTTTADPSAPGQVRAFASKQFLQSTLANAKWHVVWNTAGDVLCFASKDGSGMPAFVLCALSTLGYESGDDYPFLGLASYSATAPGGFTASQTLQSSASATFWKDGVVVANTQGGLLKYWANTASLMDSFLLGGSDVTGKYPDLPAILYCNTASKVAIRGSLVDVACAPTGSTIVNGTVEPPVPATFVTAIFGEFWIPCGGVAPQF